MIGEYFEGTEDDHIGRKMQCTSDVKNMFKSKRKKKANFKILT